MANNICPCCDNPYQPGQQRCTCCGWELESGAVMLLSDAEIAEHDRKLERARQEWRESQKQAQAKAGDAHQQWYEEMTRKAEMAIETGNQAMARGDHDTAIASFTQAVQLHYQRICQAEADAQYWYDHYLDDVKARYQQRMQEIEAAYNGRRQKANAEYNQVIAAADAEFSQARQQATQQLQEMRSAFRWAVAPWDDPAWEQYTPQLNSAVPSAIRIGKLNDDFGLGDLPALAPLVGEGHLFFTAKKPEDALLALQNALLRLVVASTPRSFKLILMDGTSKKGGMLSAFLDLDPVMCSTKVFSNSDEMGKQLDELNGYIENVIQKRLRNIDNVEDYNAQTEEIAIQYHILVVSDFPAGFDDRMSKKLVEIAESGKKAGVYILASLNQEKYALPRDFNLASLTHLGSVLHLANLDRLEWKDSVFGNYSVIPDTFPSSRIGAWITTMNDAAKKHVPHLQFQKVAIPVQRRWRGNTTEGLTVPIGINSLGDIHNFEIGHQQGTVHHGLIGGMTGSGKSTLLHVLITQLALLYSYEEIQFYLIDLKKGGVEFQYYQTLPHAKVVALQTDREYVIYRLRDLIEEMARRGQLFAEAGKKDFVNYRVSTGQVLPRILLIIDEFHLLFDDALVVSEAGRYLDELITQGRGYGIHVVLSSQSPAKGGAALKRSTYDQMGLRIALQCRQEDAMAILGDKNPDADKLKPPGEAIYNNYLGDRDKNIFIRVPNLSDDDLPRYLLEIKNLGSGRELPKPVAFDGLKMAQVANNQHLHRTLAQPPLPVGAPLQLWLGESMIRDVASAVLERYMRSNVMVLGSNEKQAYGLLTAFVLSLIVQRSPQDCKFVIFDFARSPSSYHGYFARLADLLQCYSMTIAELRQLDEVVKDLVKELDQRQTPGEKMFPDFYCVITGLHQWRKLKVAPGTFPATTDTANQLQRLAEEGPEAGIYLLTWCDGLSFLDSAFNYRGLEFFDLRVLLHLHDDESMKLLGNKGAATLDDNRALLRNESDSAGYFEKFKPYPVPENDVLTLLTEQIRSRRAP